MTAPVRSWLYVSGGRPEHFDKALASQADAVIFDLEDSVPEHAKTKARQNVIAALSKGGGTRTVAVRINPLMTAHGAADLAAVIRLPLSAIRVPKVEGPDDVAFVAEQLGDRRSNVEIQPLIETAIGVARMADIVSVPGAVRLTLGEADLCADLGLSNPDWLQPVRLATVVASRAAGHGPPIQSVFANIGDDDGLRLSTAAGQSMGFFGRSAVHPRQVSTINAACTPTAADLQAAHEILDAIAGGSAKGHAGVRLANGHFVDLAAERQARRTLQQSQTVEDTR